MEHEFRRRHLVHPYKNDKINFRQLNDQLNRKYDIKFNDSKMNKATRRVYTKVKEKEELPFDLDLFTLV